MTINLFTGTLPLAPDPINDTRSQFASKAYAFTVGLKAMGDQLAVIVPQMNADIASANTAANTAVNAPGAAGTSTTSLTIGTGNQSFTTQTGKAWQVGQPCMIASSASPTNWMAGTITAYNSGTGAMTVSASMTQGAGTFASWVVSLCGPAVPAAAAVVSTAGTGTAYTLAPSPAITSYQAGQSWLVQFSAASGASPTLTVNGVGSPPTLVRLTPSGGIVAIGANELPAGAISRVTMLNTTQALVEEMPPVQDDSRVQGLIGNNNGTTPLTKFDMSMDLVTLRNAAGQCVTRYAPTAMTIDFGLAGPAANGRDQAGAFAANSWVHVYVIFSPGGNSLALLASLTPPLTFSGASLPAGYTHWAYATCLRWNASSNIPYMYVRGASVHYLTPALALSGGSGSGTVVAVTTSAIVPSNSVELFGYTWGTFTHPTAGTPIDYTLYHSSGGGQCFYTNVITEVANGWAWFATAFRCMNAGALGYGWGSAIGTRSATINITGYTIPNGDS